MVDDQLVRAAIEARDANLDMLMGKANVTGTDIGFRYVAGNATETVAIRVFVSKKSDIEEADRVPATIDGIPTDVIEESPVQPAVDVQGKHNPLVGGISIGPKEKATDEGDGAGTLGVIVRGADGTLYGLTNHHVLTTNGTRTSNGQLRIGDIVTQPSPADHDRWDRTFRSFHFAGKVAKFQFGPITPGDRTSFSTDAALFTLDRKAISSIEGIGPTIGSGSPQLGARVVKCGRSTGLTYGTVDGINGIEEGVRYPGGTERMCPVVRIREDSDDPYGHFTEEGDSGCVYVDLESFRVVGLHIGDSNGPTRRVSFGSHMTDVERHFNVKVFATEPAPPFDRAKYPFQRVAGTTGDEWASNLMGDSGWKLTKGLYDKTTGWITGEWVPGEGYRAIEIRGGHDKPKHPLYVCVAGEGAVDLPYSMQWLGEDNGDDTYRLGAAIRAWNGKEWGHPSLKNPYGVNGYWYRLEPLPLEHKDFVRFVIHYSSEPFLLWAARRMD